MYDDDIALMLQLQDANSKAPDNLDGRLADLLLRPSDDADWRLTPRLTHPLLWMTTSSLTSSGRTRTSALSMEPEPMTTSPNWMKSSSRAKNPKKRTMTGTPAILFPTRMAAATLRPVTAVGVADLLPANPLIGLMMLVRIGLPTR